MSQELNQSRIAERLHHTDVGHTLDYHRTIDSTMPRAHELAQRQSTRSGLIVVAEQQSAGKGRHGRSWHTPYAKALLVSFIVKPPLPLEPAQIPMIAGCSVVAAITEMRPDLKDAISLKWPNDVLLSHESAAHKLGGMIVESVFKAGQPLYAIIGIGVNVNQTQDELPTVVASMTPPISLRSFLGEDVDRTELLIALCNQLAKRLEPSPSASMYFEEWRAMLSTIGQPVTVYTNPETSSDGIHGIAADVAPTGELIVETDDGERLAFSAADVSLRSETQTS